MSHATGHGTSTRPSFTRELANVATQSRFSALPDRVRLEAARAFLNWVGCVLGGCREPAVSIAAATVAELGGGPQASIIGHAQRTDIANAAFVNCISSCIMAFDDAHLATVAHPSSPAGASLFAFSEKHRVSGEDFVHAFALALELQCRLANVVALPPSNFNVGFYLNGFTAPIGIALALGNLLKLDEQKMNWAIGLAASQGSGFRSTHGSMTAHFRPAHATRCGMWAAILASKGFDCPEDAMEIDTGFFDVYCKDANLDRAFEGIGNHFEMLSNGYKPYPCGIVIHPTVDACLEIYKQIPRGEKLAKVTLRVFPLTVKICGIRSPVTPLESHVSVFHWAAAALLRGSAALPEMQQECVDDPAVAALRTEIEAIPDPAVGRGESIVEVTLANGKVLRSHVVNARGSVARPMTDDELDAKFRGQATMILPPVKVERLLGLCRNVVSLPDVGKEIAAVLNA